MSCSHCLNNSGPKRRDSLSRDEIEKIRIDISRYKPLHITLIGGEPTLYLSMIRKIFIGIGYSPEVTLTTNGFFAVSQNRTKKVLDQIPYLKKLNLSFDSFHNSDLSDCRPDNLCQYARSKNITFSIIVSTSDFMSDLKFIKSLQTKYSVVSYQKVDGSGRAKGSSSEYRYGKFDSAVLEKICPNRGTANYFPGLGYSVCCSNVVFNLKQRGVFEREISNLEQNAFNKTVSQKSIGSRCKELGMEPPISQRLSSVCNFCELLTKKELRHV